MQTLADKFRPTCVDDIVGQEHILGKGKVLRRLIESKNVSNLILFGNPGIGKTTIANLIAKSSDKKLFKLNGTTASVKDIQEIAKTLNTLEGCNGIIVYLDEIHAFSKNRQSSILSYLETGQITLIASTTENPYHSIHPAILSRCMVFELKPISNEDIVKRLKICVNKASDSWRSVSCDDAALEYIANISNGDLRKAISILEIIINSHLIEELHIDTDMVKEVSQKNIYMNKSDYYDWISMLQKSVRGSQVDAALISLAALIKGGYLEETIRRIFVIASEDVGVAMGGMYATVASLLNAAKMVGLPEASIILSHAVILLATSPKSNSAYTAIKAAMNDVENVNIGDIQPYLRDAHYSGAEKLGRTGYKYPHDYPNNYVEQEYMPENLKGRVYYKPGNNKYENAIKEYWKKIKG
ncbi:replication-associated recombination protein A [Intestinibacter bartlettii]|uniref:replication-associated recombination protein A n=1 Tax=Intestinibacter bartlettii TaxID=261299 RepID=UPI00241CA19C|nr:replication-associated recombination protein A [Intestinibacter bartlettii]MDU6471819.1 replication-associated recombination protein A [Intestinibacter bartlettii]